MSDFECKVYHLEIEEHPNADAIELAKVGEYRSIVKKGEFETGDLAVYIPEAAIVPDWMLQKMGLEGRLAGKAKNRVKAIKLRGILSQGLVYPVEKGIFGTLDAGLLCKIGAEDYLVNIGDDVTEFLGITKYEPPIPVHMAGEVNNIGTQNTFNYDIENWRKYPDVLIEGEEVIFTEKIHGTFCVLGYNPNVGQPIVSSKGLFAKGLAFKMDTDRNDGNLYVKAFRSFETVGVPRFDLIDVARRDVFVDGQPFYLLGEVFGQGVQDLQYGATTPQVRIFDIYIGNPGEGEYLSHDGVTQVCAVLDLDIVPTLYRGPFSVEKMKRWTDGKETISGKETNIREGIVMNVAKERRDPELGRVVLKSVSEKYLLRKNKNATEYA